MSATQSNPLVERYEQMLQGERVSSYFDADEIDEIAEFYESNAFLDNALNAIEFGLKMHPGNEALRLRQARYLMYLGRVDDSQRVMQELVNFGMEATLIRAELKFMGENVEEGHQILLALLDRSDVQEDVCFDALDIYADYNRFDEMGEFVERAVKVLPNSRELLRELATTCEERGDYNRAITIYNQLIDKDPYSIYDWFSLAKVEAMLKHYDKAIDACDFALAVKEDDESVISFKGYCYYDSGQYHEAIEQFKEFAAVTTEKAVAYELIGECYVKLEDNENALKYFHQALDLDPSNSNICYQLATCHYDLGNIPQAIICLQDTLRLDERDDEAHSFLGEIYLQQGEYELSYQYFTRSLELNNDDLETIRLKGETCTHLQYYDEAIDLLNRVLEQDEYNLRARLSLIIAYAHSDREVEAERQAFLIADMAQKTDAIPDLSEEMRKQWEQAGWTIQSLKKFLLENIGDIDSTELPS